MNKANLLRLLFVLLLTVTFFASPSPAQATPPDCQCVEYVKAYYGITEAVGNAYQMGNWLANHSFTRNSVPQIGAVAVMQRDFPGADRTYGHVGIIVGVTDLGSQWKILLQSSNYPTGGTLFSQFGCTNVRNTYFTFNKADTRISFYRTPIYAIRSAVTKLGSSNVYFSINGLSLSSGAYIVANTYNGSSSQKFNLIRYGGEYRIISRRSAMCVVPLNTNHGAVLAQKKCTGGNLEKWILYYSSSYGYSLKNYQTGYFADLAGGSLSPGTWIISWANNGSKNQRWWIEAK